MHAIFMSEAVTVPSLMMMTLIVFEESFARDTQTDRHIHRQTDRQTDRQTLAASILNIFKVVNKFEKNPTRARNENEEK